jgi:hypothetical protein
MQILSGSLVFRQLKDFLLLAALLLVTVPVFTQKNTSDSSNQIIQSLNTQLKKSSEVISTLEKRLTQASDTISNQNSIITSFGTIYTVLTIVFAIIGLLVPVVTYYFGIKPSREQIKNLEANFDSRLEEYLKATKEREIDLAIERLTSSSIEVRQNAITYLSLSHHEGLTDVQYFKLFKILETDQIDSTQKYSLAYVLTVKKNDFATEYCKKILRTSNFYNEIIPTRYFAMIGVKEYMRDLIEYLRRIPEKRDSFIRIISHMKIISLDAVVDLFNSDEIISLFNNPNDLEYFRNYRLTNSFEQGYEEGKIKETQLYNLVFDK